MRKLLLAVTIALASSVSAQVIHDTVSVGAGYANQVWYSLDNGVVKSEPKDNWTLGFEISGFTASILFNHVAGATLWSYPNGDTSSWTSIDTTGINTWARVYNSPEYWELGAFNVGYESGNDNDLGWGLYNPINHHIIGDSLYILKTASGSYKKLQIISLASGSYNFKYANLDGSAEVVREVKKADFVDKNFGYYSLPNNQNLDREPINQNWDLLFTEYGESYVPGYGQVTATGVFQNLGLEAAKVYPVDDKEAFDDYNSATFDGRINTIGRSWKSINMTTFQWDIQDSTVYFVYGKNGKLWKLVMRGFGGSSDGNYIFSKEEIEIVGDTSDSTSGIYTHADKPLMHVYPNPATSGNVSVVYDLKNAQEAQLNVIDLQGRVVENRTLAKQGLNVSQLSTANLPEGIYIVQLRTAESTTTEKLIIR